MDEQPEQAISDLDGAVVLETGEIRRSPLAGLVLNQTIIRTVDYRVVHWRL